MHGPLTATPSAPPVLINDPARQDRAAGLQPLSSHHQPETAKAEERRQIRLGEGTVRHVEVFQVGSARTPIM